MNSFLGNLIDRHQSGSGDSAMDFKVQPRPKTRFETESVRAAAPNRELSNEPSNDYGIVQRPQPDLDIRSLLTPHHSVAAEALTTDKHPSSRDESAFETQENPEKNLSPIDNGQFNEFNDRIKANLRNLGEEPAARQEKSKMLSDQHFQPMEANSNLTVGGEIASDTRFLSGREFNNRIQEILLRLGDQSSAGNESRVGPDDPQGPILADAGHQEIPDTAEFPLQSEYKPEGSNFSASLDSRSENNPSGNQIQAMERRLQNQLNSRTEHPSTLEHQREPMIVDASLQNTSKPDEFLIHPEIKPQRSTSTQEKIQFDNSQSNNRSLQQPGLLQIPNWLTAMQADLNNRWQEINAKTESEPVVNVTIGRVEVRAVQKEIEKQPGSKQKPSGVMSLDDYLKQREDRGRA